MHTPPYSRNVYKIKEWERKAKEEIIVQTTFSSDVKAKLFFVGI
jgi:hypothetical protein